jgi:hypothetical protein
VPCSVRHHGPSPAPRCPPTTQPQCSYATPPLTAAHKSSTRYSPPIPVIHPIQKRTPQLWLRTTLGRTSTATRRRRATHTRAPRKIKASRTTTRTKRTRTKHRHTKVTARPTTHHRDTLRSLCRRRRSRTTPLQATHLTRRHGRQKHRTSHRVSTCRVWRSTHRLLPGQGSGPRHPQACRLGGQGQILRCRRGRTARIKLR